MSKSPALSFLTLPTLALPILALLCVAVPEAAAQKSNKSNKGHEWADGVAYTTDWKEAIKAVQRTGKMLFIYNGWERKGI